MSEKGKSRVSIAKVANDDIASAVERAVDLVGGFSKYIKKGDKVALKPNLAYPYPPPATTDMRVVEAVANACFKAGAAEVKIGDSSAYSCKPGLGVGKWTNMDVIMSDGLDKVCERTGAIVSDFDTDGFEMTKLPGGVIFQEVPIAKTLLEADVVINLPAMKMHMETLVTLAIKNYHGIIPDNYKVQWHKDEIMQKILDIHRGIKTHLTIMDGLVGMQGTGPRCGTPIEMGLILASDDMVAMDAVASECMGLNHWEVDSTRIADMQGFGNGKMENIEVVGEKIADVMKRFDRPDIAIDGLYPDVKMIKGGPCVHCYGRTRILMDTLYKEGLEKDGEIGAVFVGINPRQIPIEQIKGNAFFVGDCAISTTCNLRYALGDRAICVDGCPPIASVHRELDKLAERYPKQKKED